MAIFALLYANNVMFLVDFVQSSNISLSNLMHETLQMIKKQQHLKIEAKQIISVYMLDLCYTPKFDTLSLKTRKNKNS